MPDPGLAHQTIQAGFFILVGVCALTDLARGKVYNAVTLPAVGLGIVLNGAAGGLAGLKSSLLGAAVGFGLFFLVYLTGGMGGGDVKLTAAVGALMGYPFILWAALYAVLAGGLLALGVMVYHARLLASLRHVGRTAATFLLPFLRTEPLDPAASQPLPFAFAIALGSLAAYLGQGT